MLRGRNKLCRSRGGRRPKVRNKIGNRKIRLVANRRDDRNLRIPNHPRQRFIIKARKILHRTTTTSNNHDIGQRSILIEPTNTPATEAALVRALHRRRIHKQIQPRMSAANHRNDIAYHSARRRSDNPHTSRKCRQRTFTAASKSPSASSRALSCSKAS